MDCGVISFGRHRGLPACDVPMDYLVWATETMASPPACILDELRRRASQHGSRAAIEAQAALGGFGFRSARRGRRKAARARKQAGPSKQAGDIVGREFLAGREAWLAAGGDILEPPF